MKILNLFLVLSAAGTVGLSGLAAHFTVRYKNGRTAYEKLRLTAHSELLKAVNEFPKNGDKERQNTDGGQPHAASVDEEALKAQNEDYLYWLHIPGTEIDYPVAQHRDNRYYLNHTFTGEENPCGSIFADSGAGTDFGDNTVINGHNMRDGSMFGGLKRYEKKQYFKEHPDLWLYHGGRWRRGRIFACRIAADEDREAYRTCFGPGEKAAYLGAARACALYDTEVLPDEKARLVTLSTCRGKGYKLLVQAVLDEME